MRGGVPDCDALWDAEGVRLGLSLDVTDWEGACDGLTVMEGDTLGVCVSVVERVRDCDGVVACDAVGVAVRLGDVT